MAHLQHRTRRAMFANAVICVCIKSAFNEPDRSKAMQNLDRITQSPDVLGGKPCIRGMRVTVGMIVGQVGAGRGIEQILADYPYLERDDILQALTYAAWRAEERDVVLTTS